MKNPIRTFACEGCGKTVETRHTRKRRFCSKTCKNSVHNREWPAANEDRMRAYRQTPQRKEAQRARSAAYYHANREQVRAVRQVQYQATRLDTPWRGPIRGAKSRSKATGLPFDLTDEWAAARWTGRCELTGIEFRIGLPKHESRFFWPTIDRISPAKGYTQENCRFILHAVNAFKGEENDETMLGVAEALLSN